ncbi:MAG: DUF4345 family protein [Porticoccaceae bacterium]|jgi:hypothetical protein
MTIRAVLLGLNALMFIAFGLGFIVDPVTVTPMFLGLPAPSGDLLIDMRATYGGLSLAVGIYMAYCTWRREYLYQGLLVAFLVMLALLVGRGVAILAEHSASQAMYQSLILELVLSILFGALFFIRKRG